MTSTLNEYREGTLLPAQEKALAWIRSGPKKLLIGGRWTDSLSGRTFATADPATEDMLVHVAEGDTVDLDNAVAAARNAFESPSWAGLTSHQRARYLLKIADAIEQHGEELAAIETYDNGVPYSASLARIPHIAETFRYYAGWVSKIYGSTNPSDSTRFIYMLREPMGVCGLITAWNVPLGMAVAKIAPALACGNTVVIKPANQTPLSTLRLAEIVQDCGVPPGVLNVITGFGTVVGNAMAMHMDIDKISFTGSTAVGRQVLQASAMNMKKVSLELGGKSPNIVFSDADLDAAVAAAVTTFCRNSGQICSSGTRLLVQRDIYEAVTEQVCARAGTYRIGAPFAPDTQLGPLISRQQMDRVLSYVATGQREGAQLRLGGSRVGDKGHFVAPAVFAQVDNRMTIAQEEIFGPVLSIIPFEDEADAVRQANDTIYGLAAAVWSRDSSRVQRVARALKSGRVWINTYGEADPVMSIGGYKQSGFGREYGAESIDGFTQTKSVLMKL